METDEARTIAEKEIINILMKQKAADIRSAMENACVDLEIKLRSEFKGQETIRKTQEIANAKMILVRAVRRWLSKLELRRRFMEKHEKLFDEKYKAFYYRNIKTVSQIARIRITLYCSSF